MKNLTMVLAVLSIGLATIPCSSAEILKREVSMTSNKKVETFTYLGFWLNPLLVRELVPNEHDSTFRPIVLSLDVVAAQDSNRFSNKFSLDRTVRETDIRATYIPTVVTNLNISNNDGTVSNGTFSYEWWGVTKNGVHVVVTTEHKYGSRDEDSYQTLAFFRLSEIESHILYPLTHRTESTSVQSVLSIKQVERMNGGSRYRVEIKGNEVTLKEPIPNTKSLNERKFNF